MRRCEDCIHQFVCKHKTYIQMENCEHFAESEDGMRGFLIHELGNMYFLLAYGDRKNANLAAKEILSELKKAVHEKAVQPGIIDVKPYILLKEFDAILTNMSKAIFEEGKRYED